MRRLKILFFFIFLIDFYDIFHFIPSHLKCGDPNSSTSTFHSFRYTKSVPFRWLFEKLLNQIEFKRIHHHVYKWNLYHFVAEFKHTNRKENYEKIEIPKVNSIRFVRPSKYSKPKNLAMGFRQQYSSVINITINERNEMDGKSDAIDIEPNIKRATQKVRARAK